MKKIIPLIVCLSFVSIIQSQSICEFIALPDTTVCGTAPILLHTNVDTVKSSTAYRVEMMPFALDSTCILTGSGSDCGLHTDDIHSGVIPLGFEFCFFGSNYSQCLISANGYITFDLAGAGLYSPWPIPGPIPSGASAAYPLNAIMYPWQDLLPGAADVITYQTVGVAPYRKFIVRYNKIPFFSCTTLLFDGMVVLYESTNIIETYIFDKPDCLAWNGGYGIHGLQDATGTNAVVVPGRNFPAAYTISNDFVRFVPDGLPVHSNPVIWTDGVDTVGTGPSVLVVPTDTTKYYAIMHVTPECGTGTAFDLIDSCIVNVIPDPFDVTAGPDTAICVGDSVQLHIYGTDPISNISWTPVAFVTNPTDTSPYAYPVSTTSYVVYAANAASCIASDTVDITVNYGVVPHTISSDTIICAGDTTRLIVTGAVSVDWIPTTGLSNAGIPNPLAYPGVNTTYYTILHGVSGCPALDSVSVDLSSGPDAWFPTDIIICEGSGTVLSPFTGSGTSVSSYYWSTGETTATISVSTGNTYWVEVTDAAGCKDRDSMDVNTFVVDVFAGNDTTVCSNQPVLLSGTYNPTATYLWTGGGTIYDPILRQTIVLSPNSETYVFTISVYAGSGTTCAASDTVNVFADPIPVLMLSGDTIICAGDSARIFASGALNYDWTPATNISSTIVPNPVVFPDTTTTYVVTVSDSVGCSGSGTVVVAVNPLPVIDLGADTALCCGGNTSLDAGAGYSSYSWSNGDITQIINVSASNSYSVTITDFTGCTASDSRGVGIVCIQPQITASPASPISRGTSTELSVSTSYSGSFTYNWSPTTGLSSSSTNPTSSTPNGDISYMVCVTDVNTTCEECDTILIVVIDSSFIVIPGSFSPNADGLNDNFYPVFDNLISITEMKIYNRWGDLIYADATSPWDGRYKGAEQPTGPYVWIITYSAPDPQSPANLISRTMQGTVSLVK